VAGARAGVERGARGERAEAGRACVEAAGGGSSDVAARRAERRVRARVSVYGRPGGGARGLGRRGGGERRARERQAGAGSGGVVRSAPW